MKVAIIGGSGKMGQWFAHFFVNDGLQVVITGRNKEKLMEAAGHLGVEATSDIAEAINDADVVLISVAIDSFEDVVRQIQTMVVPSQIILDVTSVKQSPVEAMHKYLGKARVLGTHPVFGPGAKGVRNHNFVLTPTNDNENELAEKIREYLETRGAIVSLMTPREHDEMIAIILGLAHFIAIVSADTLLNFDKLQKMASIAGPTFKILLTLAESVVTEDPGLYASIQMNIPQIGEIENLFLQNSKAWADIVSNNDRDSFISRMNRLKDKMNQNNPEFGKSYEDMYKLLDRL